MAKYYAVRKGRKVGIYYSWEYCKAQIEGYKGAEYKSFKTEKEAQDFLDNEKRFLRPSVEFELKAYVDGSYSEDKSAYSYGCIIINKEKEEIVLNGVGDEKELLEMRNVAGELLGAEKAIEWAIKNKYNSIEIYYDYKGIELWATGEWRAKKNGTKKYREYIKEKSKEIEIGFKKVKAHSGEKYNEIADKLAKDALFGNNKLSVIKEDEIENRNEINEIFMNTKLGRRKKQIEWQIGNEVLNEARIDEFVRKHWVFLGNKVKDIKSYSVKIDINNDVMKWWVKDLGDNEFDFTVTGIISRR